ncbi:hypothetical protein C8R43DRAFT_1009158 [Mycena crocata]|nr:hypothetical protein C8R43DRAFT_1009158 [Mycena crocata]
MPHANAVAENVLGTIGTICWTAQMIPQVWKSWREKSTAGLSPWLVLVWGCSGGFLGAYALLLNLNIPLILQPQLFGVLALISWGQCQYYDASRSRLAATVMAITIMLLIGGFEAAMVFALRPGYNAGEESAKRGVQFLGIFSSVLISLALVPQYLEIWRHKEVVGISISFIVVDLLGGVFSDLSLVFKEEFDVIAGITYSVVILLDGIVVIAALILNPRAAKRRRRELGFDSDAEADVDVQQHNINAGVTPSFTAGGETPALTATPSLTAENEKDELTEVCEKDGEGDPDDITRTAPVLKKESRAPAAEVSAASSRTITHAASPVEDGGGVVESKG